MFAVFLVSLFYVTADAASGEWYCEDPSAVIAGTQNPVDSCYFKGIGWTGEKPLGILYEDALIDIFQRFKCPCVLEKPDQHDVQTWHALLNNLPRIYKEYPETRRIAIRGLMSSLAYLSEDGRKTFSPLFTDTEDEQLWTILSAAASGSNQSIAKAFYQWCDSQISVADYVSFGHQPSLDELVAGREHPKHEDFGGSISCLTAQTYIYDRLEKLVLEGQPVTRPQVALLAASRIGMLRNTVYARHGRKFSSADLKMWFSNRSWYKPDPGFDSSVLTATDRKNIVTIFGAKKRRD